LESHNNVLNIKSEHDMKVKELESTISTIDLDLSNARNDVKENQLIIEQLKDDIFQLDRSLETEQQIHADETKVAREKLDSAKLEMSRKVSEERVKAAVDLKKVIDKCTKDLSEVKLNLSNQLMDSKNEAAHQLQCEKEHSRKAIEARDAALTKKEGEISVYKAERASIRKMIQISLNLTRERVFKRISTVRQINHNVVDRNDENT